MIPYNVGKFYVGLKSKIATTTCQSFSILPYDKTNKCCFSETTKCIQSTLYVNSHMMVPYKVSIFFLSESEIQDAYYHRVYFST